jgi:protein-S-isoprenylcysteine O-methyltransferase Ste14
MTGFSVIRFASYAASVLLAAFGIFLIGAYVAGAIEVIVEDAADKSWLYWGLALALLGMVVLIMGVGLAWWSWKLGKQNREGPSDG